METTNGDTREDSGPWILPMGKKLHLVSLGSDSTLCGLLITQGCMPVEPTAQRSAQWLRSKARCRLCQFKLFSQRED